MNIFVLDLDPVEAARLQCNKHVGGKMQTESAQMLSTAHRMLDGFITEGLSKSGKRTVKKYIHPDENLENILYKAVHFNHPCTKWTMETTSNYDWHYKHWIALCEEYEYRYGKTHLSFVKLKDILSSPPKNLKEGPMTQFPLAMQSNPECMFKDDPAKSYRAFYQTKQTRFKMEWKNRNVPEWFEVKQA